MPKSEGDTHTHMWKNSARWNWN